jgi:DNA primase
VCVEDDAILKVHDDGKTNLDKFYDKIKQYIPYAKVYIIDLRGKNGEKCDPDMYFENHTKEEFKQLIKQSKIYNEYLISSKLSGVNPKNIEEKTACLNMLVPMLISIQNFMDRKQYIELVANKLMISENDVYRKIKYYTEKQDKINAENITWDARPIFAQKVLLSMCFCENFNIMLVLGKIAVKAMQYFEPFYQNIFKDYIYKYVSEWVKKHSDEPVDFNDFFTEINSDNTSSLIRKTIMDLYFKAENLEDFTDEDIDELIDEQLESLTEYALPTYETNELECLSA